MSKLLAMLVGIGVLAILSVYLSSLTFAATFENSDLAASLTVNAFVDTSIVNSTLTFGSLDPGTTSSASTTSPINLTNTANSNTAVDVYLNVSNMTSGGNIITAANLSVLPAPTFSVAVKNFSTSGSYINSTSADTGYQENLAVGSTVSLYFWQGVPGGQAAGAYTATMRIHSVADGNAP